MTPHARICKDVSEYLKTVPFLWFYRTNSFGYGRNGIPDFLGCHRRQFFDIEVKTGPKDEPTPWQDREHKAIIAAGGLHMVVWDVEQVKKVII